MLIRKKILAGLLFAAFLVEPSFGAFGSEEPCDKLYVDYLVKAKQALRDNKPDEAVIFLQKASMVAESCAKVEKPEGQGEPKLPALAA